MVIPGLAKWNKLVILHKDMELKFSHYFIPWEWPCAKTLKIESLLDILIDINWVCSVACILDRSVFCLINWMYHMRSLLYSRRSGDIVPGDFWNYWERLNSSHHSRENDLVSLSAKTEINMPDFDWKFTPMLPVGTFLYKDIQNDSININLFFILKIIVIWGNLFGKVYSHAK